LDARARARAPMSDWSSKRVLITGVCGTVGKELLRQLVADGAGAVVGLDNNESELFFLAETYRADARVELFLGDLRDRDELIRKMREVDVVFHAAALKHVPLCERSPRDAVQTNIIGTQNVIDAAVANRVERVLFTSTDKAVNPTSVMGTSKLMAERLVTAADGHRGREGPIFASTRFGNVLGSRGSVIPLFERQIAEGGPVTLTDPAMSRFIMTLSQAVALVKDSVFLMRGGEVFVTKMPAILIEDLAHVMIEELAARHGHAAGAVQVETIGSRPGEKRYEELLNDEETRRTVELTNYFVVLPALTGMGEGVRDLYPDVTSLHLTEPYNSDVVNYMSRPDLRDYLLTNGLLGG
jgi:FlaA1/EpsC-like NDP-sugar epimerase